MDDNKSFQTKWNFDEDRCKELNYYLVVCNDAIIRWDLEKSYSYLRAIDNIIHGILSDEEEGIIGNLFKEVENIRRDYFDINKSNLEITIKLMKKITELFQKMGDYQVKHELYFRKKEGFEGL